MNTVASAVVLLCIVAVAVQALLLVVRHDAEGRARVVRALGPAPVVTIWLEATLVILITRALSGDRSLLDLATDASAWTSAIGTAFPLAGGALVLVRWLRTATDGEPTWNVPGSSLLAVALAAVVGLSSLPL